jgi:polysaccharide export outer membrane protein
MVTDETRARNNTFVEGWSRARTRRILSDVLRAHAKPGNRIVRLLGEAQTLNPPARRRAAGPGVFAITALAIILAACAAGPSSIGSYCPSSRPDSATIAPTARVPVLAVEPSAPAGSPPAAGSATSSASLKVRLLEQLHPPGEDTDLPVGPGDLIEVSVFEVEELSKLKLRVPTRGMISLPLIGPVQATGRTATELEQEISTRLQQKFMHQPQVSVFVHEHNSQRVSVMGAVRRGGVITLTRQLRLADALAMAEGLSDDADHVVYVIRRAPAGSVRRPPASDPETPGATPPSHDARDEVMAPIDLTQLADGRAELNIELQPGDVIHVPRAGSFYVGGSVERPGSFILRGRTTLQQAILTAGGVKDTADWKDVRLYRRASSADVDMKTFDLNAVEEGEPAPELRANDVVVVGKHAGKAFFFGFVDFFKGALGVSKGL